MATEDFDSAGKLSFELAGLALAEGRAPTYAEAQRGRYAMHLSQVRRTVTNLRDDPSDMDADELLDAIAHADEIYRSAETLRASLVRYALDAGMTRSAVGEAAGMGASALASAERRGREHYASVAKMVPPSG